jgi:hypothetical protein
MLSSATPGDRHTGELFELAAIAVSGNPAR